jgi:hypothetical protein
MPSFQKVSRGRRLYLQVLNKSQPTAGTSAHGRGHLRLFGLRHGAASVAVLVCVEVNLGFDVVLVATLNCVWVYPYFLLIVIPILIVAPPHINGNVFAD